MSSRKKEIIKEYIMIAIGTFITCVGVYYFMVPQDIVTGGVSGLAIVINNIIPMPISMITFILNAGLLILGFIFLGKEFGVKTIYSIVLFSFFLWLMETFTPLTGSLTDLLWLDLAMGVIISSYGLCVVFNQNASTGGTDIIARLLNKYFNMDLGNGLLCADVVVVTGAIFVFGLKIALVGIFGWFLAGLTINYFIDGFNIKKEITIMSERNEEIKEYILNDLERGVTVYEAKGGYTNKTKDILVTVLERNQYSKLKAALREMDPKCFLIVRTVHEVMGEGFAEL